LAGEGEEGKPGSMESRLKKKKNTKRDKGTKGSTARLGKGGNERQIVSAEWTISHRRAGSDVEKGAQQSKVIGPGDREEKARPFRALNSQDGARTPIQVKEEGVFGTNRRGPDVLKKEKNIDKTVPKSTQGGKKRRLELNNQKSGLPPA